MVMRLEEFKEMNPQGGEMIQYIISIWDQVEVPFTLYDQCPGSNERRGVWR